MTKGHKKYKVVVFAAFTGMAHLIQFKKFSRNFIGTHVFLMDASSSSEDVFKISGSR